MKPTLRSSAAAATTLSVISITSPWKSGMFEESLVKLVGGAAIDHSLGNFSDIRAEDIDPFLGRNHLRAVSVDQTPSEVL